jgi:hypothetical protein
LFESAQSSIANVSQSSNCLSFSLPDLPQHLLPPGTPGFPTSQRGPAASGSQISGYGTIAPVFSHVGVIPSDFQVSVSRFGVVGTEPSSTTSTCNIKHYEGTNLLLPYLLYLLLQSKRAWMIQMIPCRLQMPCLLQRQICLEC